MSIRNKTLLVLATVVLGMTFLFSIGSFYLTQNNATQFEAENSRLNMVRVKRSLQNYLDGMDALASDWGAWDETYEFMADHNENYIRGNLDDVALANINLHFMLFLDTEGHVFQKKFISPKTLTDSPFPAELVKELTKHPGFAIHQSTKDRETAFFWVGNQPALAASSPIIKSDYTGPIRGTIIFGRFLDPALLKKISNTNELPLTVQPVDTLKPPHNQMPVDKPVIEIKNSKRIRGTVYFPDFNGQPIFSISADMPRTISQKARWVALYHVAAMVVIAVVVIFLMMRLLNFYLFNRIFRLISRIEKISHSGDPSKRLKNIYNDELGVLNNSVNDMLAALEKSSNEHIAAQEIIKENEEYLIELLDCVNSGVMAIDPENQEVLHVNQTALDLLETTLDHVAGKPCYHFVCQGDKGNCPAEDKDQIHLVEKTLVNSRGESVPILKSVRKLNHRGKSIFIESFVDIRELKKTEETLRMSEEKYRRFFDQDLTGDFVADPFGTIIDCNKALIDMFGCETREELSSHLRKEYDRHPEGQAFLTNKLKKNSFVEKFKWKLNNIKGQPVYGVGNLVGMFDDSGELVQIYGFVYNETDRIHLERDLRQSQKMEAIGTLAGGIAHDFNNILSAILGYTELSLALPDVDPTMRSRLERILQASYRARDLVGQILTFSRQKETELRPMNPSLVVKEALTLLRASIPSTISIQIGQLDRTLVMGDQTQIHQMIINLCTNAAQAMKESSGTIVISLAEILINKDEAQQLLDISEGIYAKLTVMDNGPGMAPDLLDRIFDPFFTTKAPGEGTGMGLSVVHGIVKGLKGKITVESTPGEGARFDIYMPVISKTDEEVKKALPPVPRGSEHVLIVDDEPLNTDLLFEMITGLGYTAEPFSDSLDALAAFENRPGSFDIIVTDQTMPHLTGIELLECIHAIRQDIPAIICTGFSEQIESGLQGRHADVVLRKPVLTRQVGETLRHVLDKKKEDPVE